MELLIRPAARDDLIDIGDYIAVDNPARAATFVEEIVAVMTEQVAVRPESFPIRSELGEGLRVARHKRYLIFFMHVRGRVEIIRVLHASRDFRRHLAL